MLEELKILLDAVAKLPSLAVWVLVGLFAYKVCVVGSVYGVIRLAIVKFHSWATKPKHETVELRMVLDGYCISGAKEALIAQILRIKRTTGQYVHQSDVDWLREAIDDKLAKEAKK